MNWFRNYIRKIVHTEVEQVLNDKTYMEAVKNSVSRSNKARQANENDMYLKDMKE